MFVYDNISNLKSNIDAELFILDNQITSTNQREDEVYKGFINLPINEEVNLTNALILNDFNEAFASTSQMLEDLKQQKEKLEEIKKFVSDVDDSQDLSQGNFKDELQNLLDDYYSFRNDVQKRYIEEDQNLDKLRKTVNKFIPISEQPELVSEPILQEEQLEPEQPEMVSESVLQEEQLEPEQPKIVDEPDSEPQIEQQEADNEPEQLEEELKKDFPDPFKEDTFNQDIDTEQALEDESEENLEPAGIPLEDNRMLFISEAQDKVYLPYYITDLQQILLKSDYEDYDELIENDYVVPLKKYKSPRISRFKEGYNLMRQKEYESIGTSISYALKLMHNDRLHPAIISACRNSQELNTYLDCLEEDRLESFKIFEIQFDVPPMKV